MADDQEAISEFLLKEAHFNKLDGDEFGAHHQFSHHLRIHEIHHLFYSMRLKHFTIGVDPEIKKGFAGVKKDDMAHQDFWTFVIIPKVIRTVDDARIFYNWLNSY
jgi:hypothetical protein